MRCLHCENSEFNEKQLSFPVEIKGETIEVISEAFVCNQCGEPLMNSEQMDNLRKVSADAYRKQHGLLTSSEIINFRKQLKMSQIEFAKYLNVGEASIKRWETYYIQDPSQDDHIRLKCDLAYAELNALQVYRKFHSPDIYSGYRSLNLEIIKTCVCYLVKYVKASSSLFLNKLIFYSDFLHFKKYGKGITGLNFVPLKYGPCPENWKHIFFYLEKGGFLRKKDQHNFMITEEPDLKIFDDQEIETLKKIIDITNKKGNRYLFELSHQEIAFKNTEEGAFISYECAKDLLI